MKCSKCKETINLMQMYVSDNKTGETYCEFCGFIELEKSMQDKEMELCLTNLVNEILSKPLMN